LDVTAGSIVHPEGRHSLPVTPRDEIDEHLSTLQASKAMWATTSIQQRMKYLDSIVDRTASLAERWVHLACIAKGIPFDDPVASEEWNSGPHLTVRNARLLRNSLQDILDHGSPQFPGPVTTRKGQTIVGVFPTDMFDKLLWTGIRAEIWMEPGVTAENLTATQAVAYHKDADRSGRVGLVLGAGNIASIPPMDVMYKLFVENEVAILKMNPVNEYLGPIFSEVFADLIDDGYFRIAYGGAEEGDYLSHHPLVESIHMTGSDKTYEAIVFGTGDEGAARKAADEPILDKPFTSELGNVTPVIVVPGPWSDKDIEHQGMNISAMLTHNAGFNCVAARVVVTPEDWDLRSDLVAAVKAGLAITPERPAYYPGARERWEAFLTAHPNATAVTEGDGTVPWTLIEGLRAEASDNVCFTTESFTGIFAEAALPAAESTVEYIREAVVFCNDHLWGTLGATIIVHPDSLKDPEIKAAVDEAIADLRYGTICVNAWSGVGYFATSTSWGAFPGHERTDIQSGTSVVHNTYLFDRPQKSVLWAPFRTPVKPLWFSTHGTRHHVTRKMVDLDADPSWLKVPGIFWSALRG
jgi:acyl-CoA reductase-like NAD-dependent aldehyde dehydrogenase